MSALQRSQSQSEPKPLILFLPPCPPFPLPPLSEYSERKLKRFEKKNREYEAKVKQTARKTYFDSLFVMNSDMDQYGDLLRHLETEFLGGKNMYPSSLQDAINRLENYKRTNKKRTFSSRTEHQTFRFCNREKSFQVPTESYNPKSTVTSVSNSASMLLSVPQR